MMPFSPEQKSGTFVFYLMEYLMFIKNDYIAAKCKYVGVIDKNICSG
jgi:hypothetical protein